MAGTYTRWYREGTVKVVNGSTAVVGTNTFWLTAGLNPGDIFSLDGVTDYEILTISDNTHLTLTSAFKGTSADGAIYHIIRNFTAHMASQLAAKTAELYSDLMRYWDQDTQTVHGKSAYEIAKLHGYTGTEAQWLESLKAAGEITAINGKLDRIYINNAGAHNAIYRGKNLGTSITPAQINNIKNGSFDDIYPGDYWNFSIDDSTVRAYVAGCNLYNQMTNYNFNKNHIVLWPHFTKNYVMNDTATTEGGLAGSKLYTETFPHLLSELEKVIPADNILSVFDTLSDAVNSSGSTTHSIAQYMKLFLPSFKNLFGDQNWGSYSYMSMIHWPICFLTPNIVNRWCNYWLDKAASSTHWYAKAHFSYIQESIAANYSAARCYPFCLIGG